MDVSKKNVNIYESHNTIVVLHMQKRVTNLTSVLCTNCSCPNLYGSMMATERLSSGLSAVYDNIVRVADGICQLSEAPVLNFQLHFE